MGDFRTMLSCLGLDSGAATHIYFAYSVDAIFTLIVVKTRRMTLFAEDNVQYEKSSHSTTGDMVNMCRRENSSRAFRNGPALCSKHQLIIFDIINIY